MKRRKFTVSPAYTSMNKAGATGSSYPATRKGKDRLAISVSCGTGISIPCTPANADATVSVREKLLRGIYVVQV